MSYRLGIDIGGTFTDFAMIDDATGQISIHKALTTPDDPSRAVLEGVTVILARDGVRMEQLSAIIHGSTLVTNAVIERRGARTGMLVTEGFVDVLDIANERRYDIYNLRSVYPEAIVPRNRRAGIRERLRDDGTPLLAVDLAQVVAEVGTLVRDHEIQALAICFLHSYANAVHEETARDAVRAAFPDLYVSTSADVFPFIREYERWSTTTINAFTQPMVDRYLGNLEGGLAQQGFGGTFYVMTSSGGVVDGDTARRFPVRMLESGPAAGVLMSAYHGRSLGIENLLSFDMGGTTAKGAIVRHGRPRKVYELEVARVAEFRPGSGLPTKIPVIDMIEIGAGGGGIAEVDARGLIRVGPRSAGAMPGPACYGRGGKLATLTDANLVLGFYDPDFFLGGTMALDRDAASLAVETSVGTPLNLERTRAAWGIHEIINEDVARAFRVHASELGFDYRRCSMVAFGGSGPAHALRVARKLKIPRVIFPMGSGVMSAIGMLVCPMSFQTARSRRMFVGGLDATQFAAQFEPVERDASAFLLRAGVKPADIRLRRSVDMRYRGQGYEIEVPLPDDMDVTACFDQLHALFDRSYEEIFSLSYVDEELEIVNWKVEAVAPEPDMGVLSFRRGHREGAALKGHRPAYSAEAGGYVDCPVYDRYALTPGDEVSGPAFIEEREATFVIGAGDTVTVDVLGNLIAEIAPETATETAS
jgi:N-methylhydantoinase A